MSFSRYDSYIDSGIEWLGEVPSHWTIQRLKMSVASCRNGIWGEDPDGTGDDTVCVRVADFDRSRLAVNLETPTLRRISEKERASRTVIRGNLLLEKSGGGEKQPVGAVVLYDHDTNAVCSNFIARLELKPDLDPQFWSFAHAAMYSIRLTNRSINQTSGIQNLDQTRYFDELISFPPLKEQVSIGEFLVCETAKIDRLIEAQRQLVELLKEKCQAVVSHAVTKGLDPTAPMKPAGVEWLGDVPAHWEVVPLKRLISILSGFAFPSQGFSHSEEDMRLLRGINVSVGCTRWEQDVVYWKRAQEDGLKQFELRIGDVVLGMDRPWIGDGLRAAQIGEEDLPCLLLQRVAALRPRDRLLGGYLFFLLSGAAFFHHCAPEMTGVSVPHISPDQVSNFQIALPSIEEQRSILEVLNTHDEQMSRAVETAEAAMTLLAERRSALISAAVTGQIDVRRTLPAVAEAA